MRGQGKGKRQHCQGDGDLCTGVHRQKDVRTISAQGKGSSADLARKGVVSRGLSAVTCLILRNSMAPN